MGQKMKKPEKKAGQGKRKAVVEWVKRVPGGIRIRFGSRVKEEKK